MKGAPSNPVAQITNSAADRLLTVATVNQDSSDVNAEANLTFDGSTLTVAGNLTVSGTTTTLSTTNTIIADRLIELANGASTGADSGIIIERGSTGDNAAIVWDESADRFVMATTTATGASTGDLSLTDAALQAGSLHISGDIDIDGIANLDAVAIDGTVTVGANDAGHDVILYGNTALANVTWDTSEDDLILNGAARVVVPDGQLVLASTAVTSTAAELNLLDGVSGLVQADFTKLAAITSSAAELNVLDGVASLDTDLSSVSGSDDTIASAKAIKTALDAKQATIAAGSLLDLSGATVNVDLTEAAAATIAAGDQVVFLDGGAAGTHAKGSINDVATLFAGSAATTGLSASSGVLSVSDLHPVGVNGSANQLITDDGDGTVTSEGNLSFDGSTLAVTGAATTTTTMTVGTDLTVTGGDVVLGNAADANNASLTAVTESGTNTNGKKVTIGGGLGTGTGLPGAVEISSGIPTSSGTNAHSATTIASFGTYGPTFNYGGVDALANDEAVGDKVFFGTGQTVKGKLYYLDTNGAWVLADADAEVSTASMLAVACGGDGSGNANDALTNGMLIRGFIDNASAIDGTFDQGDPVFVSLTAGNMTMTKPSASGDFVRCIGFACATANVIYFNPDNTWIEL